MLSLYRNKQAMRSSTKKGISGALAITLITRAAVAAETFVTPSVSVEGDYDTNPSLETNKAARDDATGIGTKAQAILGVRTLRSETNLVPRVVWYKYPGKDVLETRHGSVDLQTDFLSQRSQFNVHAKYDYRESFFLVLPEAGFSSVDPNDPNVDANGSVLARNTRRLFELRPEYQYQLSQKLGLGVDMLYTPVRYEKQYSSAQQDYDYVESNGYLAFNVNPLSIWTAGPSASYFKTRDNTSKTNSYGVVGSWTRKWSERLKTVFNVDLERNYTTTRATTGTTNDTGNSYGASFDVDYSTGQVSKVRLLIGRSIYPGSAAAMYQVDQLNLQYDTAFTQKLGLSVAARYFRPKAIAAHGSVADTSRDTADSRASVRWNWTRTLYSEVGYGFRWRGTSHTGVNTGAAADNSVFLSFGYVALPPRR